MPHPASPSCAPTDCRAGSEGKILVMIGRASRRESLFQPGDNRQSALPAPLAKGGMKGARLKSNLPPGVTYSRRREQYAARATVGGVRKFLGWFVTAALAGAAAAR